MKRVIRYNFITSLTKNEQNPCNIVPLNKVEVELPLHFLPSPR